MRLMVKSNVFWKNTLAICSLIIISGIFLVGLSAPLLAPHDPNLVVLENNFAPPGRDYFLGTDHLGRCILSRLMYGAIISLGSALAVMTATIIIGIIIGTLSGYKGGWIDTLFMRLGDTILAFPSLVLILVIVGMTGPGLINILIAMAVVQWVWYARIIRGMTMRLKECGFVLSSRVSGTASFMIIIKHILPNIVPHIIVLATLDLGMVILHISGLSFLGLGIQPPTSEWGAMLNDARQFLRSNPNLIIYPGVMILLTVMSFNLLGDAIRDAAEQN